MGQISGGVKRTVKGVVFQAVLLLTSPLSGNSLSLLIS